ncbi:MAG TPA: phosphate/phosphite/phosphonate ABC transporter substrate-binding protein [Polyangiaceae bacterium]|nr:phosphate/phosphite/phosphonate ABC transporter substrate-binding protein [Polyangiaceae bacterium]
METKKDDTPLLTFGYAAPEASEEAMRNMTELATLVSARANADIAVSALPSYERVTQRIHKGELDLAWVSPIPFIALWRNKSIVPLASPRRGGMGYHGAIVVAADSPITELSGLAGKRAAWVDRYSAAGFVVPRIELAKAGLDVKSAFSAQHFYGSHAAVVRAIADGRADFGATFVRLGANNAVVGGPWSGDPDLEKRLRIFAAFGEIPPDVIAARESLDVGVRNRVRDALLAVAREPRAKELLAAVFGAEAFAAPITSKYEALREAAAAAVQENLLDIEEELEPEIVFDPESVDKPQPLPAQRS